MDKRLTNEDKKKQVKRAVNKYPVKYHEFENEKLMQARNLVYDLKEVRKIYNWDLEDWRIFLSMSPAESLRVLSRKTLNKAEKDLKEQEKLHKAAAKLYSLTGSLPGGKSGVVKVGEKANKIVADFRKKLKISVASLLAYGKDDKLKEKVMKEVKGKYPEMVKEILELSKKAKEKAKSTDFGKLKLATRKFGGRI